MSVSLGCHFEGYARPTPSMDPVSAGSGAIKRLAPRIARIPRAERRRIARFVQTFCEQHLTPLSPTTDISFESWIERQSTYSGSRKDELRKCWQESQNQLSSTYTVNPTHKRKAYRVNNFIKNEFYDSYKHPRMINGRSDLLKCMVGPIFDLISHEVFNMKYPGMDVGPLIKLTPVADRPVVLSDLFVKATQFSVTDYTSFECHFNSEIMESIEFQVYKYMTKHLPCHTEFVNLLRDSMTKSNVLHNKWFKLIMAVTKRLSGCSATSLGNGLGNLMFMLYIANQKHITNGYVGTMEAWIASYPKYVLGVFEGDDALLKFLQACKPELADFQRLGLLVKLEEFTNLGHASFCGNLFDPHDLVQVTDPRKVLASFGWSNRKYVSANERTKKAILRCKAMSYSYQYAGAPIIQELMAWILRVVPSDIEKEMKYIDNVGVWYREKYKEAYSRPQQYRPTPWRTRLLVEELYGVSPGDQVIAEEWFKSQDTIRPIDLPHLADDLDPLWADYYQRHVIRKYDEHAIISLDEKTKACDYVETMAQLQPSFRALKTLIK